MGVFFFLERQGLEAFELFSAFWRRVEQSQIIVRQLSWVNATFFWGGNCGGKKSRMFGDDDTDTIAC